jgi:hypothetical protein
MQDMLAEACRQTTVRNIEFEYRDCTLEDDYRLDWTENMEVMTEASARSLQSAFENPKSMLENVTIHAMIIPDDVCDILCEGLKKTTTLKILYLDEVEMNIAKLVEALEGRSSLERLTLRDIDISSEDAMQALGKVFSHSACQLNYLNLDWLYCERNPPLLSMSDWDISGPQCKTLQDLSLKNQELDGGDFLLMLFKKFPNLVDLRVHNQVSLLTSECIKWLPKHLRKLLLYRDYAEELGFKIILQLLFLFPEMNGIGGDGNETDARGCDFNKDLVAWIGCQKNIPCRLWPFFFALPNRILACQNWPIICRHQASNNATTIYKLFQRFLVCEDGSFGPSTQSICLPKQKKRRTT